MSHRRACFCLLGSNIQVCLAFDCEDLLGSHRVGASHRGAHQSSCSMTLCRKPSFIQIFPIRVSLVAPQLSSVSASPLLNRTLSYKEPNRRRGMEKKTLDKSVNEIRSVLSDLSFTKLALRPETKKGRTNRKAYAASALEEAKTTTVDAPAPPMCKKADFEPLQMSRMSPEKGMSSRIRMMKEDMWIGTPVLLSP